MQPLRTIGVTIPVAEQQFRWERDLQWAVGPLLSLFRDARERPYLFHWVDCDMDHNRWLVTESTDVSVIELVNRDLSLRDALMMGSSWFFLVDCNATGVIDRMFFLLGDSIPDDDLPNSGEHLDTELLPSDGAHTKVFPILLGGELSLYDHRELPKLLADTYGLLWAHKQKAYQFRDRPFRGGFTTVHFYRRIRKSMSESGAFGINKYNYASPGVLQFSADYELSRALVQSVRRLVRKYGRIRELVRQVRGYIRNEELNADPDAITQEQVQYLKVRGVEILELLGGPSFSEIQSHVATVFQATKIILGHFKRLDTLQSYESAGYIKFLQHW